MKKSGHKVVIIFSAIIIGLMLIVPVLPEVFFQSENNWCNETLEEKSIETTDFTDSSQVFVGFSIGREISLSL